MPIGPYANFDACVVGIKSQYRRAHPDWSDERLDKVSRAVCGDMEAGRLSFEWATNVGNFLEGQKNIVRIVAKTSESTGVGSDWAKMIQAGAELQPHEARHWPKVDLRDTARSASFRPIGLDHGETAWKGSYEVGQTFFMDYSEEMVNGKSQGRIEGFGTIFDDDLYALIKPAVDPKREIAHVSIDYFALNPVQVDGTELWGVYIPAVHLMVNQIPGDPYATVEKVTSPLGGMTVEGMEKMSEGGKNATNTTSAEAADQWPPSGAPDDYNKAPWKASDFAVVTDEGRHLPHHWEGKLSKAGVIAALHRLHQYKGPNQAEAKSHLCAHAKELGISSDVCGTEGCSVQLFGTVVGTTGAVTLWPGVSGGVVPLPAPAVTKEMFDAALAEIARHTEWIKSHEKTAKAGSESLTNPSGGVVVPDLSTGLAKLTPEDFDAYFHWRLSQHSLGEIVKMRRDLE